MSDDDGWADLHARKTAIEARWSAKAEEKERQKEEAQGDRDALRTTAESTASAAADARAARASATISTRLTAVASFAAVLALLASMATYRLAFDDDRHDGQWRAEQRDAAERQEQLLTAIRDSLNSAPSTGE